MNRKKGVMLPSEAYKFHTIERVETETAECFGYREARLPDGTKPSELNGCELIKIFLFDKDSSGFTAEIDGSCTDSAEAELICLGKSIVDRLGICDAKLFAPERFSGFLDHAGISFNIGSAFVILSEKGTELFSGSGLSITADNCALLNAMEEQGCGFVDEKKCSVFIAADKPAAEKAFALAMELREDGSYAEIDLSGEDIASQLKKASLMGAEFTLTLGEKELSENCAMLRNTITGEESTVKLDSDFVGRVSDIIVANMFKDTLQA